MFEKTRSQSRIFQKCIVYVHGSVFLPTSCRGLLKTIVAFDENTNEFVVQKGKPTEGTITLNKGDSCQVVDDLFMVCGQ